MSSYKTINQKSNISFRNSFLTSTCWQTEAVWAHLYPAGTHIWTGTCICRHSRWERGSGHNTGCHLEQIEASSCEMVSDVWISSKESPLLNLRRHLKNFERHQIITKSAALLSFWVSFSAIRLESPEAKIIPDPLCITLRKGLLVVIFGTYTVCFWASCKTSSY